VVLCGTGAHGAYHAGVLRALQEVGVKIDLVAGQGVGAAGAAIAALDGAPRLSDANGLWRDARVTSLYGWRTRLVAAAWCAAAAVVMLLIGLLLVALGVAPWTDARWAAGTIGVAVLAAAVAVLIVTSPPSALRRARGTPAASRRARGSVWWRLFGAPVDAGPARRLFTEAIWNVIKGATPVAMPGAAALGRRYAEVLQENLGQPGFRELVVVATDLDARRDLVAAMLREPFQQEFIAPRPGRDRRSEVLDLTGVGRDQLMDVIASALTPPAICEPHAIAFAADSYWRGEVHRGCDRPGTVSRLLEEVAAAGVTQAIVVSAVAATDAPHRLRVPRLDLRSRLGEFQAAAEAASLRDALEVAKLRFDAIYVISPAHNPVGPFDLSGAYDEASDRRQDVAELMQRAYEDAYRQFIEPVYDPDLSPGSSKWGSASPPGASSPDRV
jgi:hypothetical protein